MVKTRSIDNYSKYIEELREEFTEKYGEKYTNKFVNFIDRKYKQFDRVFLDKNIMWKLRDDYQSVRNGNIIFYLCIGQGFVGKTTFMKNVAHFFDPEFKNKYLCWGFEEMMDKLIEFVDERALYRSLIIDEPSDVPHPQSKAGKKFAEVMGQLRQLSPVLLFCSTDFKDMPSSIVRKLHGLFYLNDRGHGYFIRNSPEHNDYPMDEFKKNFSKEGYKIVNTIIQKYQCLEFSTSAGCVTDFIDKDGEKKYLDDKYTMLKKSMKNFKKVKDVGLNTGLIRKTTPEEQKKRFDKIIKLREEGITDKAIASVLDISTFTLYKDIRQFGDS